MSQHADQLAVNAIRTLSMDAVERASSGHPGTPMALAPLGHVLWSRHLKHDPADPDWWDRDRFVLSCGHASMLLYSLLHLTGYDLPLAELERFRQLNGKTPGHPENFVGTPGVETTTGPLGQGVGNAVGMALAERLLAERFNRDGHQIVDHRTWVFASDGDLMEGVSAEASSLAGHLGLEKLVVFWDDNAITIDGRTDIAFTGEDVAARYTAYGWRVLKVADANDLDELDQVMVQAAQSDGRPTLVIVPTVIGWGAPTKADSPAAHGAPLGQDEIDGAKQAYGWDYAPFEVPHEARQAADQRTRGAELHGQWSERFAAYRSAHPELAADLARVMAGELPQGWDDDLPALAKGEAQATRKSSAAVLNAIAERLPELVGGSADLAGSNNTAITSSGYVSADDFSQRNIAYGVREHGMGAVMNGMALHGGIRPFGGTFLIFTDYMRPTIRLAAMMGVPIVYVMTHDSIGLGEDGPTHQPIEHLASLRAIPNLHVMRPADANETAGAWRHAVQRTDGPTLLSLTRQNVPVLAGTSAEAVTHGAYPVVDAAEPDVILVATGSEVHLAVEAADQLKLKSLAAKVVSMPSWELAEARPSESLAELFDPGVPVLSVEAATSFGWARWADDHVAMDRFGASAPHTDLYQAFGFTPDAIAAAASDLVAQNQE